MSAQTTGEEKPEELKPTDTSKVQGTPPAGEQKDTTPKDEKKEQVVYLPSEEELRKEVFERAKDVEEKGYSMKVLNEILSNRKINLRDEVNCAN